MRGFFAALRMTSNCDSNSNSRSLRDDNKRGNGNSSRNSNSNSRSLRDDNKRGKGNGKRDDNEN